MKKEKFTAIIHKEDDLYVADCPEIGTVSQGYTIEEALDNLREATELYLSEFPAPQKTFSRSRTSGILSGSPARKSCDLKEKSFRR